MIPHPPSFFIRVIAVAALSFTGWIAALCQQATSTPATDLPPVRIEHNVMIPMRDGVRLAANVFRPETKDRLPVILTRTPYGKNGKAFFDAGRYYAQHGYVYIVQDVRGRGDSGGEFRPWIEGQDGFDSIEWAARQAWSSGRVGTIGGSYAAFDQWQAAEEQPPHLKAMIVSSTPPDLFDSTYINRVFDMDAIEWAIVTNGHAMQEFPTEEQRKAYDHLPVFTMDEAFGWHLDRSWRDLITHQHDPEYWRARSYQSRLARVQAPVLHLDGWYDLGDASTSLENYNAMVAHAGTAEARANQRAIIGPWQHDVYSQRIAGIDFGPEAAFDRRGVSVQWFDCYLKESNCDQVRAWPPLRIFHMGENRWSSEQRWPLLQIKPTPYYFHSDGHANTREGDGTLSLSAPETEKADFFTYDPQNPVEIVIAPENIAGPTAEDQRNTEMRPDMLVFTSAPLQTPLEITGRIRVRLWAASSAPDTDWVARLVDVHPDGYAQRLTDGAVRARYRQSFEHPSLLQPEKIYEYTIDLWETSNVFLPGHRIRMEITSSMFPVFSRNLNTGADNETTTEMQVAHQAIYHDAAHPSQIVLPVVPR
ncbi:MAG: CocE/NonD family hydrolase [Acidobacteriia bacterium]|nr:CocE/NonD family hydrolase [Terriglobia bacterium]